ncbi:MAG: hypothetical protein DRJ47_08240 [Thermoprotei archaeon]|nr:MAG: hypothetical protein DRJ47_08240 [Thermoprotei archaeon]
MAKRFCAVCGKSDTPLINNLCPECFKKENRLIVSPEPVKILLCRNCLSYFHKGKWISPRSYASIPGIIKDAIETRVISQLKKKGEVIDVDVHVSFQKDVDEGSEIPIEIKVKGRAHPSLPFYEEIYYTKAILHLSLCPSCRTVVGGKEKAILQIRAKERPLSKREVNIINDLIKEELEKLYDRDKGAVVLDIKEKKGRIDVYLASLHAARRLAHAIQLYFSGKILETQKILGVSRTGKTIIRTTIRVLIPPFKKDDIIAWKDSVYKVLKIGKNSVKLLSLENYSERVVSLRRLYRENIDILEDTSVGLVMSVKPPNVLVLDLSNYETLDIYLEKIPFWIEENTSLKLVKWRGRIYLAPLARR